MDEGKGTVDNDDFRLPERSSGGIAFFRQSSLPVRGLPEGPSPPRMRWSDGVISVAHLMAWPLSITQAASAVVGMVWWPRFSHKLADSSALRRFCESFSDDAGRPPKSEPECHSNSSLRLLYFLSLPGLRCQSSKCGGVCLCRVVVDRVDAR